MPEIYLSSLLTGGGESRYQQVDCGPAAVLYCHDQQERGEECNQPPDCHSGLRENTALNQVELGIHSGIVMCLLFSSHKKQPKEAEIMY